MPISDKLMGTNKLLNRFYRNDECCENVSKQTKSTGKSTNHPYKSDNSRVNVEILTYASAYAADLFIFFGTVQFLFHL